MRVPLSWLSEHCDPGLAAPDLAERLAMTGTEVERVTVAGPPSPDNYVIGRVTEAEQHPDADRLRVCTVDTGDGERTIVCGAPNVAAGQTVAVALPGAVLPDGTKLGRAKLRGVESDGMILSERELGVGEDHDGILVLADGDSREAPPAPGTPLAETIPLAEPVLELEVTPNRPDCLGIRGVAREVHAITCQPLAPDPWEDDAEPGGEGDVADHASVTVDVPELCPRFTARVFEDVTIGPSPAWLKARLMAAGQRPINNVVDITNYVMLLTAQPLHAFDLDLVPGGAADHPHRARGREDDDPRRRRADLRRADDPGLRPQRADGHRGDHGRPGLRGLREHEPGSARGRELERAQHPAHLAPAGPALRGVEPLREATAPRALHAGAADRLPPAWSSSAAPGWCRGRSTSTPGCPSRTASRSAPSASSACSGCRYRSADQAAYLERLGFAVSEGEGGLGVSVPPDRHYDVTREADLIEEVARIHGLEGTLPATLPATGDQTGRLSRSQRLLRRTEDVMRDLGFDEIVGWSFAAPDLPKRLRIGDDDPRSQMARRRQPARRGRLDDADDAARLAARRSPLQRRPRRRASRALRIRARLSPRRRDLRARRPARGPLPRRAGAAGARAAPARGPGDRRPSRQAGRAADRGGASSS